MQGLEIFKKYAELKAKYPDIDEWLSESIVLELGEEMLDPIQTAALCLETDLPWNNWRAFEKVAVVLNGRPIIGDIIQDLDAKEIGYAISVLAQIFPNNRFDDEIIKYMVIELTDEGLVVAPPSLSFLQAYLPFIKLSKEQEKMQGIYIRSVEEYIKLMYDKED